jgi:hypothetical protein
MTAVMVRTTRPDSVVITALFLLFPLLAGCAGGSIHVADTAPPGEQMIGQAATGAQETTVSTEQDEPTAEMEPGKACKFYWPVFFPCMRDLSIDVTRLEPAQGSYMLVPRPGWFDVADTTETMKQALTEKAQELCKSSGIASLVLDKPDDIGPPPRGWLRCR